MAKNKVNVSKPQHAHIDRRTHRVTLPVPGLGFGAMFSITGTWRDAADDPDATAVEVHCVVSKGTCRSSHRLTKDSSFKLPYGTLQLIIETISPADCTTLTVRVEACSMDTAPPRLPTPASPRFRESRDGGRRLYPVGTNNVAPAV